MSQTLPSPLNPDESGKKIPSKVYEPVIFNKVMFILMIITFLLLIPALLLFLITVIIGSAQTGLNIGTFFQSESYQLARISGIVFATIVVLNRFIILGKASGFLYTIQIPFDIAEKNINKFLTRNTKA